MANFSSLIFDHRTPVTGAAGRQFFWDVAHREVFLDDAKT
jgi:hypothetical protein